MQLVTYSQNKAPALEQKKKKKKKKKKTPSAGIRFLSYRFISIWNIYI